MSSATPPDWRTQAAHDPEEEPPPPTACDGRQLLPDAARHALLVQWHSGLAPTLPAVLENVINRLTVADDDEDFGEIPHPSPTLVDDLGQ
ncbi:Glycoprotein OS=Streptomyces rimosus subsp. rimosus (strain ATCC / DSM 40260 / JCM 4667 / NRRL 2234) OX=1265868 GN=SRIM_006020 PE=4 SV=1 [Streptomyces rimosus subsp. rimosus]